MPHGNGKKTGTGTKKFPKHGTYEEQQEFVKDLPPDQSPDDLTEYVNSLKTGKQPYSGDPRNVPSGAKIEVYNHTTSTPASSTTDLGDDPDEEIITAQISRLKVMENGTATERMTINMPGEKSGQAFTVITNPDGSSTVIQRKLKIADAANSGMLFHAAPETQQGTKGVVIHGSRGEKNIYDIVEPQHLAPSPSHKNS